ncbi:peptidase C1B, bleomycin hydrolase [Rhodotorula toruloides]
MTNSASQVPRRTRVGLRVRTEATDHRRVLFGCDVGKFSSSSLGIMSTKLWDLDEGFGTSLKMSKAQRLETGDSAMTHSMLITAVHIDEKSGKPTRWRIENSWGPDVGEKGYFVMDDEWFSEYVYQVCADRKYVDSKLVDLFDKGEPTVLPPWARLAFPAAPLVC